LESLHDPLSSGQQWLIAGILGQCLGLCLKAKVFGIAIKLKALAKARKS